MTQRLEEMKIGDSIDVRGPKVGRWGEERGGEGVGSR